MNVLKKFLAIILVIISVITLVSCSKNNNADTIKDNSITDIDKNTQNFYESITSFAEVPTDVVKTTNAAETTNDISVTPIMTDQYILSYKDGLLYIDFYKGTESVVTIPNEYLDEQIHGLKTGAFASCFIIEKIIFSEGITDIGSFSFHYCENLKEVVLPTAFVDEAQRIFGGTLVKNGNKWSLSDKMFCGFSF